MDIRWLPLNLTSDMKPLEEVKKICHEKHIPLKVNNGQLYLMCDTKKYNDTLKLFKK